MPRNVPFLLLKETLDSTNRALRPRSSNSFCDQARAKKPRTSSSLSISTMNAPLSLVSVTIMLPQTHALHVLISHYCNLRDRDNEATAALAVLRLLLQNLIG